MDLTDIRSIWRQALKPGGTPVIYKQARPQPLLVRVVWDVDNREWLTGDGRRITWQRQYKAWEIPTSRFNDIVERMLERYGRLYLIQLYRDLEKCAPACWNALGFDCECSCMGANHGSGRSLSHVVTETFAFEWSGRKLSCRLISR